MLCFSSSNYIIIVSDNGPLPAGPPSHHLKQWWLNINCTLGIKLQWNLTRNTKISIQETAFENYFCRKAVVLSRPRRVEYQSPAEMINNSIVSLITYIFDAHRNATRYTGTPLLSRLHCAPVTAIIPTRHCKRISGSTESKLPPFAFTVTCDTIQDPLNDAMSMDIVVSKYRQADGYRCSRHFGGHSIDPGHWQINIQTSLATASRHLGDSEAEWIKIDISITHPVTLCRMHTAYSCCVASYFENFWVDRLPFLVKGDHYTARITKLVGV